MMDDIRLAMYDSVALFALIIPDAYNNSQGVMQVSRSPCYCMLDNVCCTVTSLQWT